MRQSDERFEALADDVGMRKLGLVREGFPCGVKKRSDLGGISFWPSKAKPRLDVLMEAFLSLQPVGDHDERSLRKQVSKERRKERLGGDADGVARQCSARLHALTQGLRSGRLRDGNERVGRRRRGYVGHQAFGRLQGVEQSSRKPP